MDINLNSLGLKELKDLQSQIGRAIATFEDRRKKEALEAYQSALQALDKIPPARRNVPAMAELEQRLRTALADIDKPLK